MKVGDDDSTAPFNTLSLSTKDERIRVDDQGNVFTRGKIEEDGMLVRILAEDRGEPKRSGSTLIQVSAFRKWE